MTSYFGLACRQDEFKCSDGYCLSMDYLCNGANDCGDWSDETDCGNPNSK